IRSPYVPALCLPSHPPQLPDSPVRPGLAPALRLAQRRYTTPATAGADSPPHCSHPKSGKHPLGPGFSPPPAYQLRPLRP
ncbi:MAG: hypothetical protein OXJ55_10695, partial [Caldilineaceae bacterium]|nr:hypothetical protein [Caldilineaceae bacterium]